MIAIACCTAMFIKPMVSLVNASSVYGQARGNTYERRFPRIGLIQIDLSNRGKFSLISRKHVRFCFDDQLCGLQGKKESLGIE